LAIEEWPFKALDRTSTKKWENTGPEKGNYLRTGKHNKVHLTLSQSSSLLT
jgi:hypothetical protein